MIKSMFSGVAGLRTHQTQMDVIGNNIANVNTNGFKSSRVVFRDMFYRTLTGAAGATNLSGGSNPSQIGIGAQVSTVDVINTNGGPITTGRSLDAYINGEGYFAVMDGAGNQKYTRLGRFDFDTNGNLVDGARCYAMGYLPQEPTYETYLDNVTIDFGGVAANPDKGITQNANTLLKDYKIKVSYKDPVTGAATADTTSAVINSNTKEIVITYTPTMDAAGKILSTLEGADIATALQKMKQAVGADGTTPIPITDNDGKPIIFNDTNTTPPKNDATTLYTNLIKVTVTGKKDEVVDRSNSVISKVTNCDTTKAPAKVSYGNMSNVKNLQVDSSGIITGSVDGEITVLGQLAVATFSNPAGLTEDGSSYFVTSTNSGEAEFSVPGQNSAGDLTTSALEGSNVDLANEFSSMILTQRGFQANSKVITVSDTMLEELINLKR